LRRASAPDMAHASTFPCNAASARENDDAIHLYAAVASNRATAAVVRLLRVAILRRKKTRTDEIFEAA
jgi:hypothetical protein